MKKLLTKVKTLHVNHEVLAAAILHLSEEEQVKVNKLISQVLGLPVHATTDSILGERQKRVDDVNEFDVILDTFRMLERVTETLEHTLEEEGGCGVAAYEVLADAQMLIASINNEK